MNEHTPEFDNLEEALDRLFDRELSEAEQDRLADQLDRAPETRKAFRETTDILLALRQPVDAPDLTARVLTRMREQKRLTPGRRRGPRRIFTTGRLALAAALLGAVGGVLLLQKYPQTRSVPISIARAPDRAPDPAVLYMQSPAVRQAELAMVLADPMTPQPSVWQLPLDRDFEQLPSISLTLSSVDALVGGSGQTFKAAAEPMSLDLSFTSAWAADESLLRRSLSAPGRTDLALPPDAEWRLQWDDRVAPWSIDPWSLEALPTPRPAAPKQDSGGM